LHKKGRKKSHKKKPTQQNSYDFGKYIVGILLLVSFSLIAASIVIFTMIYLEENKPKKAFVAEAEKKIDTLMEKMDAIVKTAQKKEEIPLESDDYENALKIMESKKIPVPPAEKEKPKKVEGPKKAVPEVIKKPKLAIIIDDISSYGEVNRLKKTKLSLSLSLFPPTKNFPSTPKIARDLDFYMIHLPLEAMNFSSPQERTLTVKSSEREIFGRIKQIRRLFPSAKIINNHTGSKFTSDRDAMIRLMYAMDKYGFDFVDSKTIGNSKAIEAAGYLNKKILTRDIFLDNVQDVSCIRRQLRKAVKLAKKNGSAIAIGHPKQKTIEALMESSDILKDVEVVYVKELI